MQRERALLAVKNRARLREFNNALGCESEFQQGVICSGAELILTIEKSNRTRPLYPATRTREPHRYFETGLLTLSFVPSPDD